LLAVVFAAAGVGKLLDLGGSRQAVRDFGVPEGIADAAGVLLPVVELAAAVLLVLPVTARWGAALALLLLLGFIAGIVNALRHGVAPDCHCFGQLHSAPAGRGTLVRNGVLAAVGAFVLIEGPGPALDTWVSESSAAEIVALVLALVTVGLAAYTAQIYFAVGKMAEDLAAAQRMAAGAPPGLPVGAKAPDFSLASLGGATVTLEELRERRLPVLLVFASPGCSSCLQLFPDLRRWQRTLSERLTIAVISAGTVKENKTLADEHQLDAVLIQAKDELALTYRIRGTPTAVLVTADGTVGSVPAESMFGIEPLVRRVLRDGAAGSERSKPGGLTAVPPIH
jgi:methylamine dehydrogenase accessory protein MauD